MGSCSSIACGIEGSPRISILRSRPRIKHNRSITSNRESEGRDCDHDSSPIMRMMHCSYSIRTCAKRVSTCIQGAFPWLFADSSIRIPIPFPGYERGEDGVNGNRQGRKGLVATRKGCFGDGHMQDVWPGWAVVADQMDG